MLEDTNSLDGAHLILIICATLINNYLLTYLFFENVGRDLVLDIDSKLQLMHTVLT